MSSLGRSTRRFYRPALAFFLLLVSVFPSTAQTWPQRPVKFIPTLGPGSGVDFGTRLLGDRLSKGGSLSSSRTAQAAMPSSP
jgi:tripartite-type tricarboxylate transporter receptor subunit TctC